MAEQKTATLVFQRYDPNGRGRTVYLYRLGDRAVSSTGYVIVEVPQDSIALFLFAACARGERQGRCLATLIDATDPDQLIQSIGYSVAPENHATSSGCSFP